MGSDNLTQVRIKGKPVIVNYRAEKPQLFWVKSSLDRTGAVIIPFCFLEVILFSKGGR
jgi:hypothetical protein